MKFLLAFIEFEEITDDFDIDWSDNYSFINGVCVSEETIRDLKELHGMSDEDIVAMIKEVKEDFEWNDEETL